MSEVDRLSNSGLYPALPIADKRSRERPSGTSPERHKSADEKGGGDKSGGEQTPDSSKRPPKSIIDDYA